MKIQEVFESYINSDKTQSSLKAHKGKVDKYISFIGNQDVEIALSESLLRKYILEDKELKPKGKYDALNNFYHYYHEEILNVSKRNVPVFPIDTKEFLSWENKEKRKPVYFPKEFDFNCLFDDRHYEHLNNYGAALAVKSSLALALSAGYDSGEMFPTNGEHEKAMKMDDIFIEEDYIKVRNFSSQSTVPFILIQGKNAEYIKEYYKLRISFPIKKEWQRSHFIANTWNTNELSFDFKIATRVYIPHDLVSYMLKYITLKEGTPTPLITDLRANMVLHSLYKSKGSALQDIIELYGFLPFVKQAFEEYCMTTSRDKEPIFSVLPLDTVQSEEPFNDDVDEKKKIESRINVIDRLVRDNVKVKKLKKIYGNSCQICNEQITLIDEISYSEVHHIQPFNKLHQGIDDKSNMIVLCPNHHKVFDMGIIALDPENHQRILHVDSKNPLNQKMLVASKHRLSSTHVRYHYENIFMPLRESLNEGKMREMIRCKT